MRAVFEKLAKYAMLRGILYIVLGVLMLLFPETMMTTIVYILGGYVIAMGLINILACVRNCQDGKTSFELVTGVLLVVMGILIILFTRVLLSVLPVFFGVLLILGGIARLVEACGGGSALGKSRIFLIIWSILITIGGIVVIVNPFSTSVLLFQVFGVLVIAQGIGEVASYFSFKNISKE